MWDGEEIAKALSVLCADHRPQHPGKRYKTCCHYSGSQTPKTRTFSSNRESPKHEAIDRDFAVSKN